MTTYSYPRVLFLAPSAYPLGGVAVWLDYLVQGLRGLGFSIEVGLVSGRFHDVARYLRSYPALDGFPVANATGSAQGRRNALATELKRRRPDIVCGVNVGDLYGAVRQLRQVSSFEGRAVMTLHAIESDLFAEVRANADVLDSVIATNRLSCQLIPALSGYESTRVLYAPYGVELDSDLGQRQATVHPGALTVAWVGRLEESQKRISVLPRIAEALRRLGVAFELVVAGDGPDRESFLAAMEHACPRGSFRYLGALSATELSDRVYAKSDVLLLTSSWETGPIVAWEAASHGLAIVTSDYVGRRLEGALVDEETALVFDGTDADAGARQLSRLRDDGLRCRIGRAAMQMVMLRYSRATSVSAWAEALCAVEALPRLGSPGESAPIARSGRLDRWLGPVRAETVRRLVGRKFTHREPGGEWPHAVSGVQEALDVLAIGRQIEKDSSSRGRRT